MCIPQITVPHVELVSFRWKFQLKNIFHGLVHLDFLFIAAIILNLVLALVFFGKKGDCYLLICLIYIDILKI